MKGMSSSKSGLAREEKKPRFFASDLFRMYTLYAEKKGWEVEILSANETGIGGYKEIIFMIKGRGAYSRMKFESGVHRVQRIPAPNLQVASIPPQSLWQSWRKSRMWISKSRTPISAWTCSNQPGLVVRMSRKTPPLSVSRTSPADSRRCQDERSQLQKPYARHEHPACPAI